MLVWRKQGTRIVGYLRSHKVVVLEPTPVGGWRWKLAIVFVDTALLTNPFAMAPRSISGETKRGEAVAKYQATEAVAQLAAA